MPIFAYGDANFTNSSYGSKSTPTTGMLRSLQRIAGYVNVVLIDEFRTSACCATCGALVCSIKTSNISHRQQTRFKKRAAILHSRGVKEDPTRKMPDTWDVRGQKVCRNPDCGDKQFSFLDRDINAAKGMVYLFEAKDAGLSKPEHYSRSYKFDNHYRTAIKKSWFKHQTADPLTFKTPHGDGGTQVYKDRLQAKQDIHRVTGTTAPLAGPPHNPRPLLPTSQMGRSHYRTATWPLDQERDQERVPVTSQNRGLRAVGEPTKRGNSPLTATPSSILNS
jgi:hypothetical protein